MKDPAKMSKDELRNEVIKLRHQIETSGGLKCPNCDDVGFYAEAKLVPGYDGEPDVDWEQVQCEFCWTVDDSIFSRDNSIVDP